jgi:hypothetical protein
VGDIPAPICGSDIKTDVEQYGQAQNSDHLRRVEAYVYFYTGLLQQGPGIYMGRERWELSNVSRTLNLLNHAGNSTYPALFTPQSRVPKSWIAENWTGDCFVVNTSSTLHLTDPVHMLMFISTGVCWDARVCTPWWVVVYPLPQSD